MRYLVVGLGNVGHAYVHTRHNVGFMVVDHLAARHGATFQVRRLAAVTMFEYQGRELHLVKPTTYMNGSGAAVQHWCEVLCVALQHVLVIVDDLNLPLGKLRIRPGGSPAGHNGLKSIDKALKTSAYPRLRFGIGHEFPKGQQAHYVLGKFPLSILTQLPAYMEWAEKIVLSFCVQGVGHAMNHYN